MSRIIVLIVCVLLTSTAAIAQLSPGDLTTAHQNLEGTENCTKCHTIGKTLSNNNCIACHTEIQSRLKENKGFHSTVKNKGCVECHKEHHGRNFSIIHFEKQTFDHLKAGFVLDGKHALLKCEQCHTPSKIIVKDAQSFSSERKERTYLGLSKDCKSCHSDEHKGQFTVPCAQCHNTTAWKPLSNFTHEKTQFPLTGSHEKIECIQCHKKTWAENTVMQFIDMKFSTCSSCHTDPHNGKFRQECNQCHTTESWMHIKGKQFDHSMTKFPLKGKHAFLQCEQCHAKNKRAINISGEIGFKITRFQKCAYCHQDAHGRQFVKRTDGGQCESCHTVDGFVPSKYSLVQHSQARFSLTGSHTAIPCIKCHVDDKVKAKCTKKFLWDTQLTCTVCHNDIHKGQFADKMTNGCETCHNTDSWESVTFSHDKTLFPLRGKHASTECSRCHVMKNDVMQFKGTATKCNVCHEDQHAGQFARNNITECERCHRDDSWNVVRFDHNTQSRFALTGKHVLIECEKCHKLGMIKNKQTIVYKPLGTKCVNCHPEQ